MSGNTFGKLFCVTTFGESHGPAIGCIVDGCPAGLNLDENKIQPYLDKRRPGQSFYTTQRRELDKVTILSGVFQGKTTGAPIALIIANEDVRSRDYDEIADKFRPGHADFTYYHKYGHRDHRGGGRSSARETAARVAAGAIARIYLAEYLNIEILGYLSQMGDIKLDFLDPTEINNNAFFSPDKTKNILLEEEITNLRKSGDSIGAKIRVLARNMPIGLGNPVFDKLDASLAYAMMSINAVKAVSIGAGFDVVNQRGSKHRDEITPNGFLSNNAGGILGGISSGQDIIVDLAVKPTSSITTPARTINNKGEPVSIVTKGRHDPCVGIRAVPIAEAMMALVLIDFWLQDRGYHAK